MAKCANCRLPLPAGAEVCPNCGRIVAKRSTIPLFIAIVGSVVVGFCATVIWFALASALLVRGTTAGCGNRLPMQAYVTLTIAGCLVAIVVGVRAARRGNPNIAAVIIIIAVFLLAPATTCGATMWRDSATYCYAPHSLDAVTQADPFVSRGSVPGALAVDAARTQV